MAWLRGWSRLAALIAAVCVCACANVPRASTQTLSGPYRGVAVGGREIALSFEERERAFRAEGTIGAGPIVLAGAVGWRGVATMLSADGGASRVALEPAGVSAQAAARAR